MDLQRPPPPPVRSYIKTRHPFRSSAEEYRYARSAKSHQSPDFVWYRTDPGTVRPEHPAAQHPLRFFNFDVTVIFSFKVSPLGLMPCDTLMYQLLFSASSLVLRH